jgi:hypothetical protein
MFAKLTSTKLASIRVLRQKHSALSAAAVPFVAPAHANDNRASRHGRAGTAERPVLTCRWVPSATGGLECRWYVTDQVTSKGVTRPDEPGGAARAQRPVALGGRLLPLVAG